MKKNQLGLLFFATIIFISCGGGEHSSEDHEAGTDNTEESMEDMEHTDAKSNMAEMIPALEGARVFFGNLEDGAVVTSPVKVIMGSEGVTVKAAGEIVEGTGHHHIIINEGPTAYGTVVGADDTHIHFGKGQEETELILEPGTYSLTLQFADGFHRSYGEGISTTITIEVK
jgi:hypothetical protein